MTTRRGILRSLSASVVAPVKDEAWNKDLSQNTDTTANMDMSEPIQSVSVSHHDTTGGTSARVPRSAIWGRMGSFRSGERKPSLPTRVGSFNGRANSFRKERKLPSRQNTFNSACTDASQQQWEEEKTELLEKIEALEMKLKSKEVVLQSMMAEKASRGDVPALSSHTDGMDSSDYHMQQLVIKDNEISRLEVKVKEQAIQMENMEKEQAAKIQEAAQQIFEEFEQQENEESVWEKMQEQDEAIQRLTSEKEYQEHTYQKRERELNQQITKLKADMEVMEKEREESHHESFAWADASHIGLSNDEVKSIKDDNKYLHSELENKDNELRDWEEEAESLQAQLQLARQESKILATTANKKEGELKKLKEQVFTLQTTLNQARQQSRRLSSSAVQTEEQVVKLLEENTCLEESLEEARQQAEVEQENAQNLMKMVLKMEQDKENELYLLNIAMSEINTALQAEEKLMIAH